jgi:hypothetical protein
MNQFLVVYSIATLIQASTSRGSCNSTDRAIWQSSDEFSLKITKFAVSAFGRSSGVVERLTSYYPSLSNECAVCFGEAVACGTENCFFPCLRSATSPDCVSCSQKFCTPALMTCVGVSDVSELPPPPSPNANADVQTTQKPIVRTRKVKTTTTDDFSEIVAIVFGEGETTISV